MPRRTDEMEAAVLAILASDPGAWFSAFNPNIVNACGGNLGAAEAVCKELRRKGKVDAEGRGKWATYGHMR